MTQTTQNPIQRRLNEMVATWFTTQNLVVLPNQKVLKDGITNIPLGSLLKRFNQETLDQAGQGITTENKKDALLLYMEDQAAAARRRIIEGISYDPKLESAGLQELNKWLLSILGRQPTKVETIGIKHFLWQICRKAKGLKVTYHMMPIFSGQQGDGKSEAIKKLISPIKGLTISGQSVHYITDQNNYKAMSQNLCIFTDEMARCSTVDIERLKQVITGDDLNYRVFHTQENGFADQNCTLIGASNKEFRELIQDTTGVRRFLPYRCKPHDNNEERRARWAAMDSIDAALIWSAINENQEEPYLMEVYDELREFQESLRTPGSIEEWLSDTELKPGDFRIPLSDLYSAYKTAASDANRKDIFSKRAFKLTLQDRGFVELRYSNGNINYLCNKRSIQEQAKANNNKQVSVVGE